VTGRIALRFGGDLVALVLQAAELLRGEAFVGLDPRQASLVSAGASAQLGALLGELRQARVAFGDAPFEPVEPHLSGRGLARGRESILELSATVGQLRGRLSLDPLAQVDLDRRVITRRALRPGPQLVRCVLDLPPARPQLRIGPLRGGDAVGEDRAGVA